MLDLPLRFLTTLALGFSLCACVPELATETAAPFGPQAVPLLLDADQAPGRTSPTHLYRLSASLPKLWPAADRYDFGDLDRRFTVLLATDPEARMLVRLELDSPRWWETAHPNSLVPVPPGLTAPAGGKLTHASWFASAWRKAAAEALTAVVKHLEASPNSGSLIGYELASGHEGTWSPWHQTAAGQEVSAAAQQAFRTWLERRYGSLASLRVAWGQPRQPLPDAPEVKAGYIFTRWDQISIPLAKVLLDPARSTLYDPSGQEHFADYQLFLGQFTAETIVGLVRAAQGAAPPERQWGACYGHTLWCPDEEWPPSLRGQLGLSRILAAPEIDFLVGPPGAAPEAPVALGGSLRAHGKLYLPQPRAEIPPPAVAEALPPLAAALVVDEYSLAHLSPGTDLQRCALRDQAQALTALGGRWEGFLPGDIAAAPECGLHVMSAVYRVPENIRTPLRERLARPGVVVWVYAAGALDSDFIDSSALRELTGFRATVFNRAGELRATLVGDFDGDEALVWGPRDKIQPWFALVNEAHARGHLGETAWPALATRQESGTLTAYCAAPGVPAAVLQALLAERDAK